MLEVVEQDQELLAPQETVELVSRPDRLRYLRRNELRVGEARERDPEDAVAQRADQFGCDLERQTSLSCTTRTGDREQPRAVGEQCDELAELVLSTDERARRDWQVGGVERPQWREVAVAQLMETLGVR